MSEIVARIGTVAIGEGKTVKLRNAASIKSFVYWDIPHGNRIEVTETANGWSHGTARDETGKLRTGWMMSQYIKYGDEGGGSAAGSTNSEKMIVLKVPENVAADILNQIAGQMKG